MDHALLPALLACALGLALPAAAQGTLHEFKSWEIGCDNTLRCEAQGYHEGNDPPAALRVLRDGGPRTPVRLIVAFGTSGNDSPVPRPDLPVGLRAGTLALSLPPPGTDPFTEVRAADVPRLLPWLLRGDALQIASGSQSWKVSLAGASAALLKMDELQGRVDTAGALVRKGPRPEPPPAPALPVVAPARVATPPRAGDDALAALIRPAVTVDAETCPLMHEGRAAATVTRLSPSRVLVIWDCWRGAYQGGHAAWVAEDRPPYAPERVVFQAPGPDAADEPANLAFAADGRVPGRLEMESYSKSRGIGDCASERRWAWDGRRFALVSATQSPCRDFEFGGLPITLWRAALR